MEKETTNPKSNGGVIMNEDFVTFDLAKKLKEKGFKNNCIGYYDYVGEFHYSYKSAISNREIYFFHNKYDNIWNRDLVDAPTIPQVLKWLRDEKKIHIQIIVYENGWYFEVWQYDESPAKFKFQGEDCDSYEQAALAGITWALDNLI